MATAQLSVSPLHAQGPVPHERPQVFVVLLGAPGAGKGTQARMLAEALGLPQISSGDIFREHLRHETALGLLAREYMDQGELVPDDVTIAMVMDRLARQDCVRGAILDGFPRTLSQADALDQALAARGQRVGLVPLLEINDDAVIRRLAGRRVCRNCQAMYHLEFSPPKIDGRCDQCGPEGELYRRTDDEPETVRNRLFVYYKQTAPLVGYYYAHRVLVSVDGDRSMEQVQADLQAMVLQVAAQPPCPGGAAGSFVEGRPAEAPSAAETWPAGQQSG